MERFSLGYYEARNKNEQPGLEVAPSDAPVVSSLGYSDLQVAPSDAPIRTSSQADLELADDEYGGKEAFSSSSTRKRCGLSPRLFWALIALAILTLVAIVAGAVGGTLAKRGGNDSHR